MSSNNLIKNITSKDLNLSLETTKTLINSGNEEDFKELTSKAEFIFPFLRKKINDNFVKLINKENLNTIFAFSKIYCEEFESLIVNSWVKFADEDLTDELLELFEKGTDAQKTYCAGYFKHINDPLALEYLKQYSKSDNFSLKTNCARALKEFGEEETLNENFKIIANSKDEFEKLKAYEFAVAYNSEHALNFVLANCFSSPFVLNIICMILDNNDFEKLKNILDDDKIAQIFQILLENYPENLTLDTISYYQIFDFINFLNFLDNSYAKNLLYCAKEQFSEYLNNEIYIFDLDKNTKNDLKAILDLLKDFSLEKTKLEEELEEKYCTHARYELALEIIKTNKIKKYAPKIIEHILSNKLPQKTLIKALVTLKELEKLKEIDKSVLSSINDETAKLFCLSLFEN